MPRVFLDEAAISGDQATITGADAHHLLTVLRMGPGDALTVVDPCGAEREAVIMEAREGFVLAKLGPPRPARDDRPHCIELYHGLPRASRFETSLRMCTELGVSRFVPVLSARSVVRLAGRQAERKRERWTRIVEQAAKQCGRTTIPAVCMPLSWEEALAEFAHSGAAGIMPSAALAGSDSVALADAARRLSNEGVQRLAVFIGPESGFDLAEEASGCDAGLIPVTMGPRILRTETAAVVAVALSVELFGGLGGR